MRIARLHSTAGPCTSCTARHAFAGHRSRVPAQRLHSTKEIDAPGRRVGGPQGNDPCRWAKGGGDGPRHVVERGTRWRVALVLWLAAPAIAQPTPMVASTPSSAAAPPDMNCLAVARDSLVGDVYAPGRWHPLPLTTFFS